MAEEKDWTLMVYMSGDNNLSVNLAHALNSIEKSAKDCESRFNLLVYYDGYTRAIPTLYCDFSDYIKPFYIPSYQVTDKLYPVKSEHNEDSSSTNSVLNFVNWCVNQRNRKAKNYGLIFSGHSFGFQSIGLLKDEFSGHSMSMENIEYFLRRITENKEKTYENIKNEAEFLDELNLKYNEVQTQLVEHFNAKKFDNEFQNLFQLAGRLNQEIVSLKDAQIDEIVQANQNVIIGQKLGILGFDSCTMAMLEVGYQIKDFAETLIASEGSVPVAGWSYAEILGRLSHTSNALLPKDVAKEFVEEFIKTENSYAISAESVDMAAWDLSRLPNLKKPIRNLCSQLNELLNYDEGVIYGYLKKSLLFTHKRCQTYMLKQNIDLGDFCKLLMADLNDVKVEIEQLEAKNGKVVIEKLDQISSACRDILEQLDSCVIQSGFSGGEYQFSQGISMFFPWSKSALEVSEDDYKGLDFIKNTQAGKAWLKFLEIYLGKVTYRKSIEGQNRSQIEILYNPRPWKESRAEKTDKATNNYITKGAGDPKVEKGAGDPKVEKGAGDPKVEKGAGDPKVEKGAGDPKVEKGAGDPKVEKGAYLSNGGNNYLDLFTHYDNIEIPWDISGLLKKPNDSSSGS